MGSGSSLQISTARRSWMSSASSSNVSYELCRNVLFLLAGSASGNLPVCCGSGSVRPERGSARCGPIRRIHTGLLVALSIECAVWIFTTYGAAARALPNSYEYE